MKRILNLKFKTEFDNYHKFWNHCYISILGTRKLGNIHQYFHKIRKTIFSTLKLNCKRLRIKEKEHFGFFSRNYELHWKVVIICNNGQVGGGGQEYQSLGQEFGVGGGGLNFLTQPVNLVHLVTTQPEQGGGGRGIPSLLSKNKLAFKFWGPKWGLKMVPH